MINMNDILKKILETKQQEITAAMATKSLPALMEEAKMASQPRDFLHAIRTKIGQHQPAVIAEIKKLAPEINW